MLLFFLKYTGKVQFENIIENLTYHVESDEQTGYHEKVIIESRDKTRNPASILLDSTREVIKTYDIPVGSHISVNDGD